MADASSKQRVKLTDKQRRELLWFARNGVDLPQNYEGRRNDQQNALEAKGLIELSHSRDTGYLTEDGLAWLEADPEAAPLIEIYRRVTQKREQIAREMVGQIQALLNSDMQFASLFTQVGFTCHDSLGNPGNEGFTGYQMEATFNAFLNQLEKTKRQIDQEIKSAAFRAEQEEQAKWIKERGYLTWDKAAEHLKVNEFEFRLAFDKKMINQVVVPFYGRADYFKQAYFDPATLQLNDEQRATLKKGALLTRWQAAERLGIDPKVFDKLKKGRIDFADTYPTNSGYLGYLYRQEDVDSLKDYI